MYCKYCGKQIRDDSTFCDECGNQLEPKKKKRSGIVLAVFFVVVALAIAASVLAIVVVYNNYQNQEYVPKAFSTNSEIVKMNNNLKDLIQGDDIQRNPEKYNGKQFELSGYVIKIGEKSIFVSTDLDGNNLKKQLADLRGEDYVPDPKDTIEIPYTNNKSPRLLVYDKIKFKGTVHTKLVDNEVKVTIDSISDVEIIED